MTVDASGIVSGTWEWSHGWIADRARETVPTARHRSSARVWSVQRAPKRTARVCTWPRSSRRYAPARRPSCRYLPRGRGNLSVGLMAGEARGLIRFAGPSRKACRRDAYIRHCPRRSCFHLCRFFGPNLLSPFPFLSGIEKEYWHFDLSRVRTGHWGRKF